MKNRLLYLGISITIAVGVYVFASILISIGFIIALDHICHYDNFYILLMRPALWGTFGFLSGLIWPELPYQISRNLFKIEKVSKKMKYSIRVTLGLSGLLASQVLPMHDFIKCTS